MRLDVPRFKDFFSRISDGKAAHWNKWAAYTQNADCKNVIQA